MTKEYDVLIVGAGHNSLTTAAYLAKAGLHTCVFEKNSIVGGGAVSREVTAPGFIHDTHASGITLAMANPMLKDDELGLKSKFGLELVEPEMTYASLFTDETWIGGYGSLDSTCESIAKFSSKDAEAYREFALRTTKMAPLFIKGMFKPPIPARKMAALLGESEGGREVLSLSERSVYDFIHEIFEHPKVRMHTMKWVTENMMHAKVRGTARDFYLLTSLAHTQEDAAVVGGTQQLSNALVRCIQHYGGEIRTNTWVNSIITRFGEVKGIELEDGEVIKAKKCVIASIHPHLLSDYVGGLDQAMLKEAKSAPLSSYGGFMTHWALHEAPSYTCPEVDRAMVLEFIPESMENMISSVDDCVAGKLPSIFNGLAFTQTNHDPTRAPEGKHTTMVYGFVPFDLENTGPLGQRDVAGWTDEIRDQYRDWILKEYSRYCTNMSRDNIIASAAFSPKDMGEWSPTFQKGDIFGISNISPMGARPTERLAQYSVPGAEGLYLSGPFCHPGGGITGGGRGTAMKALMDLEFNIFDFFRI